MSEPNHEKWMAYIDGEMGAEEAAAFSEQLSNAEREDLAADEQVEAGISRRLAEAPQCPDDLWTRVQSDVWHARKRQQRNRAAMRWAVPLIAAAAVIIFFTIGTRTNPGGLPPFLKLAAASVPELQNTSEVEADEASVEDLLRRAGMRLSVVPAKRSPGHRVWLLGARTGTYDDATYVRVLYSCCNLPIEVVIASKDSTAALEIMGAKERHKLILVDEMGNYVFTVIGPPRHAREVVGLVTPE